MERLTWVETKNHVKSSDGGIVLRHPRLMNSTEWVDDMRRWPEVSYGDIFNNFVLSVGVDGSAMKIFRRNQGVSIFT